jgi:hypothetical protein
MKNYSALIFAVFLSQISFAQTPDDPNAPGWHKTAKLGSNLSLSSSQDVVGQTDGTSETYGLNFKGEFNRMREHDEWRTEASLIAATTKTPSISRFVKSNDELKLNTAYLRFFNEKKTWGPYARLEGAAPMFKGEDVQAAATPYAVTTTDKITTVTAPLTSYRLTDGFKPLTTKESLGFFWKAVNEENLKVEARLGAAALQIAAAGQYTAKGKNTAGQIVVDELSDVSQLGLEAALSVKGKVDEKSSYEAGIESLTPFVNNKRSGDDRDALNLTNVDGFVKLTSNITSWASFGYDYKVKLQPQLTERAQQTHMIVLNVSYNLL